MSVVKPPLNADEYRLSLPRLLFLDLPSVVSALLLAAVLLLTILIVGLGYLPVGFGRIVFSSVEMITILVFALVVILLAGPLLVMRILHFRSVLRHGIVLHGQVIRRTATFAEYRIDYVFQHHYQAFQQRNGVRRQRHIEARRTLEPGSVVSVLVHPYLPERSLLIELYRA